MKPFLLVAAGVAVFVGLSMPSTPVPAQPPSVAIEFNGRPLDAPGRQQLQAFEAQVGPVPPGRYWYDPMSGGAGVMGGPAAAYLGPGLTLGGPMQGNASGGGNRRLTGVFVNGRELHPLDVAGLRRYGQVYSGRYWWDRFGNVGLEGGPMLFNFYAVAQASQSGGTIHKPGSRSGESTTVTNGCVVMHGRLRSSDDSSKFSYYGGC